MKAAQIIAHLGLGDLIITSAIAEYLRICKGYEMVYYPCRSRDLLSVKSFFLESPTVNVYAIDTDSTTPTRALFPHIPDTEVISMGFYSTIPMDVSISFGQAFYQQLGIPYIVRFDMCPIRNVVNRYYDAKLHPNIDFDLIHEDPHRGYSIKQHPENSFAIKWGENSVLAYYPFIKYARTILAIDSFLIHLVDSVNTDAKLEYHKYARPRNHRWNDLECPSNHIWNVIQ